MIMVVWYAEKKVPNTRNFATEFAYTTHILGLVACGAISYGLQSGTGKTEVVEVIEDVIDPNEGKTEEEIMFEEYCAQNQEDPLCLPDIDGVPRPVL